MNKERKSIWLRLAVGAMVCGSLALSSINVAQAAEKVTFRLDWKIYGTHALFFAGLKQGFFAAEGLDVEIKEGNGSAEVVKLMGAGDDSFAFAAGVNVLQGVARGVPVKSVYGIMQRNPLSVMSFKSANISKPSDLVGKTISASGGGAASVLFKTFLKINNVDPGAVQVANLGMGGRNRALLSGQAAAMIGYSVTDVPKLKLAGHDVVTMHFSDWRFNTVSNGIIINTALEKKSPETIKRFLRALTKSIDYARANPKEAVEDLSQRFPLAEKEAMLEELKLTIDMLESDATKGKPLGWQAQSEWDVTQDVLVEAGVIEKRIAIDTAFSNAYLP